MASPFAFETPADYHFAKWQEERVAYGLGPESQLLAAAPASKLVHVEGDVNAITAKEFAGYQMFKSFGCVSCHQGVNVGGNMYQRHGVFHPLASPKPEIVRVPSLRNVAVTPPYFHDGSASTLSQAVQEMAYAQLDRKLTNDQTKAIVVFLNTLTGTYLGKPVSPAGRLRQSDAPK